MKQKRIIHGNSVNECLAKVSAKDVRDIRSAADAGFSTRDLEVVYRISHKQIASIINRTSWRHIA